MAIATNNSFLGVAEKRKTNRTSMHFNNAVLKIYIQTMIYDSGLAKMATLILAIFTLQRNSSEKCHRRLAFFQFSRHSITKMLTHM